MTTFLTWLTNQSSKVYTWFGNQFGNYYSSITNLPNTIVQTATNVTSAVVNALWNYVYGLGDDINATLDWADEKIKKLTTSLANLRTELRAYIDQRIRDLGDGSVNLFDLVVQVVEDVTGWRLDNLRDLIYNIQGIFDQGLNLVRGLIDDVRRDLAALAATVQHVDVSVLFDFYNRYVALLSQFAQNPARFIWQVIFPSLIRAIELGIAYALGSVDTDLPIEEL